MKKLAIIAAVSAFALTQLAQASISMVYNFDVDKAGSENTYSGTAIAPDLGTVWNSLPVPQSTAGSVSIADVVDSYGSSTGVSLYMDRNGGDTMKVYDENSAGNPNPSDLMRDYTYYSDWAVTLSGMDAGWYNVYIFAQDNNAGGGSTWTMDAANGGASGTSTGDLTDFRDIYQAGAEGNVYLKLLASVDGSGTLGFSGGDNLNGFQIEAIPEPATIGLLGIFGGAMVFIRRKFKI